MSLLIGKYPLMAGGTLVGIGATALLADKAGLADLDTTRNQHLVAAGLAIAAPTVGVRGAQLFADAGVRSYEDLRIAGRSFDDVLQNDTLRFTFDSAGPLNSRTIKPWSAAAKAHVEQHGSGITDAIHGALGSIDDARYGSILNSMSFARTPEGDAASTTLDWLASGPQPKTPLDWFRAARAIRSNLSESRSGATLASWQDNGGISLSAPTSKLLMEAIADGGKTPLSPEQIDAVETVRHEMLHGTGTRGYDPQWVEEGGVELVARHTTRQTIDAMGLQADPSLIRTDIGSYEEWVEVMRRLANHAGFDLTTSRGLSSYEHTFLGLDQGPFLDTIAGRIGAHHKVDASQVRAALDGLDGSPRKLRHLERKFGLQTR